MEVGSGTFHLGLSKFLIALSAFTDIYLVGYPCFVIYKLKISTKKKIGLTIALRLGIV